MAVNSLKGPMIIKVPVTKEEAVDWSTSTWNWGT